MYMFLSILSECVIRLISPTHRTKRIPLLMCRPIVLLAIVPTMPSIHVWHRSRSVVRIYIEYNTIIYWLFWRIYLWARPTVMYLWISYPSAQDSRTTTRQRVCGRFVFVTTKGARYFVSVIFHQPVDKYLIVLWVFNVRQESVSPCVSALVNCLLIRKIFASVTLNSIKTTFTRSRSWLRALYSAQRFACGCQPAASADTTTP